MTRSRFGRPLLALWGAAALVVSSYLLGSHLVAMPATQSAKLSAAVAELAQDGPRTRGVVMMHVLYESCRCSKKVVEHLLERGRDRSDRELVVLVEGETDDGSDTERKLRIAGYEVRRVKSENLAPAYGVEAAPLLVVADNAGRVQYVGGYGDRKQSPVVRDREIASNVLRGEPVSPLPLFGCAVSDDLRAQTDPLGVLR